VRLIWAQGRHRVIGMDGTIPWHLPEDMARFRQLTMGGVCVMGRRTWDSLPDAFRPLPGRENAVLTSSSLPLEGARVFASVTDVLASYQDLWVIGGAAVYAAFLPFASEIHLTELDLDVPGDTFAPELSAEWACAEAESHTSASGIGYAFKRLERAVASPA
jgi:dihydrofolate reductase